uniref:Uncharacterized protein n=1 Tax=uncultured Rhodospirillales bacterium HF4000_24M03 TaxID=710788 RepID=E0XW40_9PROT|nr:hypothetical protein [uncultured Rhodospirillales bacterium HF4000_24M03]
MYRRERRECGESKNRYDSDIDASAGQDGRPAGFTVLDNSQGLAPSPTTTKGAQNRGWA